MKLPLISLIALIIPWSPVLADGDAQAGEKVFRKCAACHSVDGSKKKSGPHLAGLAGRAAGSVEGYKYSSAMTESGIVWDQTSLRAFLTAPRIYVEGTRMSFPGIRKEEDLVNLLAYLEGL